MRSIYVLSFASHPHILLSAKRLPTALASITTPSPRQRYHEAQNDQAMEDQAQKANENKKQQQDQKASSKLGYASSPYGNLNPNLRLHRRTGSRQFMQWGRLDMAHTALYPHGPGNAIDVSEFERWECENHGTDSGE